tara:strand:- start:82 stop:693 length:612 start_codon:yes stop_codon:yes gene_type:complete
MNDFSRLSRQLAKKYEDFHEMHPITVVKVAAAFLLLAGPTLAQNSLSDSKEESSLSRYQVVGDGEDLVKLSDLESLEDRARVAYTDGRCLQGAEIQFPEKANIAANILRQTLEPFYSADRDDSSAIVQRPANSNLASVEGAANNLLMKRNEYWFLEAKCYFEKGDFDSALNRTYRALEYIHPLNQEALWVEAREMMFHMIGYE